MSTIPQIITHNVCFIVTNPLRLQFPSALVSGLASFSFLIGLTACTLLLSSALFLAPAFRLICPSQMLQSWHVLLCPIQMQKVMFSIWMRHTTLYAHPMQKTSASCEKIKAATQQGTSRRYQAGWTSGFSGGSNTRGE